MSAKLTSIQFQDLKNNIEHWGVITIMMLFEVAIKYPENSTINDCFDFRNPIIVVIFTSTSINCAVVKRMRNPLIN